MIPAYNFNYNKLLSQMVCKLDSKGSSNMQIGIFVNGPHVIWYCYSLVYKLQNLLYPLG